LYYIKDGQTRLGTAEANIPQDIQLSGPYILKEHCVFENRSGVVTLITLKDALVYVNGRQLTEPEVLTTGSRVILGKNHVFRFTHPEQAREKRQKEKTECETKEEDTIEDMSKSVGETVDWNYAHCELMEKQGIDLKAEMKKRLVVLEEQFKREKKQAEQEFETQILTYEARIDELQKKVTEQEETIMSNSVYSSTYSPEYDPNDDSIFGELAASVELSTAEDLFFNFSL
jgi:kinesin family member 1